MTTPENARWAIRQLDPETRDADVQASMDAVRRGWIDIEEATPGVIKSLAGHARVGPSGRRTLDVWWDGELVAHIAPADNLTPLPSMLEDPDEEDRM